MKEPYSVSLKDILPGVPFLMPNCRGSYIRIKGDENIILQDKYRANQDLGSIPIVEIATGHLCLMNADKRCMPLGR